MHARSDKDEAVEAREPVASSHYIPGGSVTYSRFSLCLCYSCLSVFCCLNPLTPVSLVSPVHSPLSHCHLHYFSYLSGDETGLPRVRLRGGATVPATIVARVVSRDGDHQNHIPRTVDTLALIPTIITRSTQAPPTRRRARLVRRPPPASRLTPFVVTTQQDPGIPSPQPTAAPLAIPVIRPHSSMSHNALLAWHFDFEHHPASCAMSRLCRPFLQ